MKDFNSDYIAFLPIGVTFMVLGLTTDNLWSFFPVGLVFFVIALTGGFTSNNKDADESSIVNNPDESVEKEDNS